VSHGLLGAVATDGCARKPAAFSAGESFEVGVDLGSTVDPGWLARGEFPFDGEIGTVRVE